MSDHQHSTHVPGQPDFRLLQNKFGADEIEWRLQQAGEKNGRIWGIGVPYVTNRAIQDRLDAAVGPGNWKNEFSPGPAGGLLCTLSIRVGDEWIGKVDGAENTDIEGVKGGLSGAMKRAAVQWGIGRYLYALDEFFVQVNERGKLRGKTKQGTDFKWDPPQLPAWALPEPQPRAAATQRQSRPRAAAASAAPEAAAAPVTTAPTEPAADTAPNPGESPMLEYIRRVGAEVDEAAEFMFNRKTRNLKDFTRENWALIKSQPAIAQQVAKAIQAATGTPLATDTDTTSAAA